MPDATTIQAWLTEAELARHKLTIGQGYASVQVDGVSNVTYARADLDKLDVYIASLRARLACALGTGAPRRGPSYFGF
jgi:hypothetical protein